MKRFLLALFACLCLIVAPVEGGRTFRAGSSYAFSVSAVPTTGYPYAIGTFFRFTAASVSSGDMTIASYSDAGDAAGGDRLMAYGSASGSGFAARSSVTGFDREAKYGMSVNSTTWWWVLAVFASDSDRRIYVVDVGSIGTAQQTSTVAPAHDTFDIGRWLGGGSATTYATGSMAYFTVWDCDFTTTEVTDYWEHASSGHKAFVDPRLIKPNNIKFFWRGNRVGSTSSTEYDSWGGLTMTNVNGPLNSNDPFVQRQAGY